MRTSGSVLIFLGLVFMVVEAGFAAYYAWEQAEWEEANAVYVDARQSGNVPPCPRKQQLALPGIIVFAYTGTGAWLFVGGCMLFGASAIRESLQEQLADLRGRFDLPAPPAGAGSPVGKPPGATNRAGEPCARPTQDGAGASDTSLPLSHPRAEPVEPKAQAAPAKAADGDAPKHAVAERAGAKPKGTEEPEPTSPVTPSEPATSASAATQPDSPNGEQEKPPPLAAWWPVSYGGNVGILLTMGAAFFAAIYQSKEAINGFVGAGIWYLLFIGVRYVAVVLPSREEHP